MAEEEAKLVALIAAPRSCAHLPITYFFMVAPIELLRAHGAYLLVCALGQRHLLDAASARELAPFEFAQLPQPPTLVRCLQCGAHYANTHGAHFPFQYACGAAGCTRTALSATARHYHTLHSIVQGELNHDAIY